MSGALTAVTLGVALLVSGIGFGSPSLLVAGVGLCGLAAVAVIWVGLATPRRLERAAGPARIIEGQLYPLRIQAHGARRLTSREASSPTPPWRRRSPSARAGRVASSGR